MKQEIAKRLAAELRSGKYEQGQMHLRTRDNKFCCLGVLCELAIEDGVIPSPTIPDDLMCYVYGLDGKSTITNLLPVAVKEWADMESTLGKRRDASTDILYIDWDFRNGVPPPLFYMNDRLKMTFEQIADDIEKNWDKY